MHYNAPGCRTWTLKALPCVLRNSHIVQNHSGESGRLGKRVIACLDVRTNDQGDLVVTKGDQYDVRESSGSKNVRNLGLPVDLADRYSKEGADEITFLNITGFRDFPLTDLPMLEVTFDTFCYHPAENCRRSYFQICQSSSGLCNSECLHSLCLKLISRADVYFVIKSIPSKIAESASPVKRLKPFTGSKHTWVSYMHAGPQAGIKESFCPPYSWRRNPRLHWHCRKQAFCFRCCSWIFPLWSR